MTTLRGPAPDLLVTLPMVRTACSSSRSVLGSGALVVLLLGALSACDSSVEGDASGEGGDGTGGAGGTAVYAASSGNTTPAATTGASTGQGGAPSTTSAGSPTTTTGSSGDGGATSSGAGGPPSCDGARIGESCDVDGVTCETSWGQGVCDGGMPRITSCVDGRWEIWTAISCGAFTPTPDCEIPGRYVVEPSGPYEPADDYLVDQFGGPFEVTFEVRDDGLLWISAGGGSIEPGTCDVQAFWSLDEDCEEELGEEFCVYHDRRLQLDMATAPATGTVGLECWGECDNAITAPVTATRL
jgi:hypothetical protein